MRVVKSLLLSWAVNAANLAIVVAVLGGVTNRSVRSLLAAAALFGVLNTILKPLLRLVTVPLRVITLGLISFGIAMLMLALTSAAVDGFAIHGFSGLIRATIWVWLVNLALNPIEWAWKRRRGADRSKSMSSTSS